MRRSLSIATWAFGLVTIVAAAIAAGAMRWKAATARAVNRMANSPAQQAGDDTTSAVAHEALADLPAPVRRYFAFALVPGQKLVLRAHFGQAGVLRADDGAAWKPFTAVEHFSTRPVGFVWDAAIAMMAMVPARIRDGYAGGAGASEASVAGLIPVGKLGSSPEVTSSSLLRYLAESPWLPTALLPQAGVRWTPLDHDRARATLTDATTTVSMEVEFGGRGEIVRVSALRYRDVRGTAVLTPWTGRFHDYVRTAGMMIPLSAEAGWNPPEGAFSVWRGHITKADYEFSR
jgi:hypothetical protein